ncbi:MAG TPA: toxin-antitoxin system, antitoxin component, Xre family protein [Myxococcota bacterium]|nr:toxin-antitoxin system, antitoxin component, Xre family protein [Myxococcota bacterium]
MSQPERRGHEEELLAKIRSLPPERVAEVEDFVDFLRLRDEEQRLTQAASKLSEAAFARVWENPDDADYDRL